MRRLTEAASSIASRRYVAEGLKEVGSKTIQSSSISFTADQKSRQSSTRAAKAANRVDILEITGSCNARCKVRFKREKSEKHWGPRRNGGGKVVGVVPTKIHPNQIKIAKVCFWGGFWVGGVG